MSNPDIESYIRNNGTTCIHCGSRNITFGGARANPPDRVAYCLDCQKSWLEILTVQDCMQPDGSPFPDAINPMPLSNFVNWRWLGVYRSGSDLEIRGPYESQRLSEAIEKLRKTLKPEDSGIYELSLCLITGGIRIVAKEQDELT